MPKGPDARRITSWFRSALALAVAMTFGNACGGDEQAPGLQDEIPRDASTSVDAADSISEPKVDASAGDATAASDVSIGTDAGLDLSRIDAIDDRTTDAVVDAKGDASGETGDASGETGADTFDDSAGDAADAALDTGPDTYDGAFVTAAHPPLPQLQFHGGPVLATPHLTAVTYDDFDQRDAAEDLVGTIGATGPLFWTPALAEYGVGPATASAPVRVAGSAPTAIDDLAIQSWLAQQLDGTHAAFGTPTSDSLYVIFYPRTTDITNATIHSCHGFGGYHGNLYIESGPYAGVDIAYAVVAQCDDLFTLETAASHEIVESCNDPFGLTKTPGIAWSGVDTDHSVWELVLGGEESADLCQLLFAPKFIPFPYTHGVQRTWSNASASANHDPCAPVSPFAYFNAAPVLPDTVTIKEDGATHPTKGVLIPLNQSKAIEVDLYSETDIGSWTVTATDLSPLVGGGTGPNLTFAWDTPTGQNGSKLHLTITALAGTPKLGGEPFMLTSSNGGPHHEWIGYVAQN